MMTKEPNPFAGMSVPCCGGYGDGNCVCGENERVLRGYLRKELLPPMTAQQRQWCLHEIDSVEGWSAADYVNESDNVLARTVLCAWTDYCQDKGIL
jgi:hypothetical protein